MKNEGKDKASGWTMAAYVTGVPFFLNAAAFITHAGDALNEMTTKPILSRLPMGLEQLSTETASRLIADTLLLIPIALIFLGCLTQSRRAARHHS
ncbi:hypothetical protein A2354_01300 [Candidatus Amesbacteria bacterium RIFOXYB1_FULL_47_12]|nr:MAG: hypothetical protein A2354_01300 [Candidatus Amesbacteria bacterium RIFOXYB1_FULL_47_12]